MSDDIKVTIETNEVILTEQKNEAHIVVEQMIPISGGSENHSELNELDYASSGHTGFASSAELALKADLNGNEEENFTGRKLYATSNLQVGIAGEPRGFVDYYLPNPYNIDEPAPPTLNNFEISKNTGSYFDDGIYTYQYLIYGYKTINGRNYYSSPLTTSEKHTENDSRNYSIWFSLGITGLDGVVIYALKHPTKKGMFLDITNSTDIYDGDGTENNYQYGMPIITGGYGADVVTNELGDTDYNKQNITLVNSTLELKKGSALHLDKDSQLYLDGKTVDIKIAENAYTDAEAVTACQNSGWFLPVYGNISSLNNDSGYQTYNELYNAERRAKTFAVAMSVALGG